MLEFEKINLLRNGFDFNTFKLSSKFKYFYKSIFLHIEKPPERYRLTFIRKLDGI